MREKPKITLKFKCNGFESQGIEVKLQLMILYYLNDCLINYIELNFNTVSGLQLCPVQCTIPLHPLPTLQKKLCKLKIKEEHRL